MLMNKSLLFYILSMVGRQQARDGRKANLFIPQIRIYTSRRTKCSQHCQGPGHNPPSLGAATGADPVGMLQGDHWDPPPAKIPWGLFLIFPVNIKHPTPSLSSKSWCSHESKAGLLGKSGESLCDVLLEKGAGVMGGHIWKPQHNGREWCSIQREKQHLELAEVALWSSPEELCLLCQSPGSRSCAGRGAERTGSCRARGLAHTETFALPWLLAFHLLHRVCCGNVYFAVWWLMLPL